MEIQAATDGETDQADTIRHLLHDGARTLSSVSGSGDMSRDQLRTPREGLATH